MKKHSRPLLLLLFILLDFLFFYLSPLVSIKNMKYYLNVEI